MKKLFTLSLVALFTLTLGACSQNNKRPSSSNNSAPAAQSNAEQMEYTAPARALAPAVIPDEIKAAYSGVVITVRDLKKETSKDVTVHFDETVKIDGTPLIVNIEQFYPDFVMSQDGYSTRSMEPNNVAAKIHVTGIEPEFNGWLFAGFPGVHPFESTEYDILIKDAVKK